MKLIFGLHLIVIIIVNKKIMGVETLIHQVEVQRSKCHFGRSAFFVEVPFWSKCNVRHKCHFEKELKLDVIKILIKQSDRKLAI